MKHQIPSTACLHSYIRENGEITEAEEPMIQVLTEDDEESDGIEVDPALSGTYVGLPVLQ